MMFIVTGAYNEALCSKTKRELCANGFIEPEQAFSAGFAAPGLNFETREDAEFKTVEPREAWSLLATGVDVANIGTRVWARANEHDPHAADFSNSLDADYKFLFVYEAPRRALARLLSEGAHEVDSLPLHASRWCRYHEAVLRFFDANRSVSILVHESEIGVGNAFVKLCATKFNLPLSSLAVRSEIASSRPDPLAELVAAAYENELAHCNSVYEKLQTSSDLPEATQQDFIEIAKSVWRDAEAAKISVGSEGVAGKNMQGLDPRRAEPKKLTSQVDARKLRENAPEQEISESLKVREEENELLSLQLAQVRKELEYYFRLYRMEMGDPIGSRARAGMASQQAESVESTRGAVEIDFRNVINGTNWHNAETDGRWAGPEKVSYLSLPSVKPGEFRIEVRVVDAMDMDILNRMRVTFDGQPLAFSKLSHAGLNSSLALLKCIRALIQKRAKFPILLTANVTVNSAAASHMLSFAFPRTVSPTVGGSTDTRKLAIRVKEVRMLRLSGQD